MDNKKLEGMKLKMKFNETPVRTSKKFGINDIELEDFEVPENIEKCICKDGKPSTVPLTYGVSRELEKMVYDKSNKKIKKIYDENEENQEKFVFELNKQNQNLLENIEFIFEENSSTNFIKEMFMESSSFDLHSSCAKLYKHSIINEILFDEGRSSNEDRYFLFKALCHSSKCVGINNIVYLYEKHENSLSTKEIDERIFDNIYFCEKMDKTINNDFPKLAYYSKYNMIITYLKVYRVIYRSDSKIIKK